MSTGGVVKMFEIFAHKLDMIASAPEMPWLQYGAGMPLCYTSGTLLEGGSVVLLESSMQLKGQQIPVFAGYVALKKNGLELKPNQHGVPIPYTKVSIIHRETGKRILPIEYSQLSLPEKNRYNLISCPDVLTIFNVEQTKAERSHPTLWAEWQERYAGAPPTFLTELREIREIDFLVDPLRPKYVNYFPEKEVVCPLQKYYNKCSQVLAYIAYKSLPRQENDILAKEPKFALLASELAGAFLCSNFGLKSIPNPNFLENMHSIRVLLSIHPELLPDILLQSNRMGAVLNREIRRYKGEVSQQDIIKNISAYIEKASETAIKVARKEELFGISIKGVMQKGMADYLENECSDVGKRRL